MIACLTMDTLRPRSDAGRGSGEWLAPGLPASRTQRGQGRRRRSSARVFSVAIGCWELLRSGAKKDAARPGSFRWQSTAGSCYEVGRRKTQLGQGLHWVTSGLGKLRRREAASLRRDLRPARVEAAVSHSQLHRRHERPVEARRTPTGMPRMRRRTHLDPSVEDEAQHALRPGCPDF